MSNTAISDPMREVASSTPRKPGYMLPGAVGHFEEDYEKETNSETLNSPEALLKLPTHELKVLGSITFSGIKETTGSVVRETLDAGQDLWANYLIGNGAEIISSAIGISGPTAGEGNSELTQAQDEVDNMETANRLQEVRGFLHTMATNQANVEQNREMDESIRLTGRVVTEEDSQKVGTTKEHIFSTHVLHQIAESDQEIVEQVEEQEAAQEATDRVYGADMNRNFEDQNMNNPG